MAAKKAPAKPAKPQSPAAQAPAAPFLTEDPEAAYQHFLALAKGVADGRRKRLSVDSDLVVHNVASGVKAFAAIASDVKLRIPDCPVDSLLELPALALGLLYAADRVVGQGSSGEIARRLASVSELRAPLLLQLEIFANPLVKLADPQRVKAIRSGHGPLDKAHDGVNIVGYFKELGAAIAGKHPFTEAQLATLATDSAWLVQQLDPGHAVTGPAAADPAAVIRDGFWTLVSERHDTLRASASVVLGLKDIDLHLPPLGTRAAARPKKAPAPND